MLYPKANKKAYPRLGEGIYLAYDVAQILKLKYSRVRYLMKGFWQSYTFGPEDSRAINFYALIEFYVYYYLREQNLSSLEIKKIHELLAKDFNTEYPFASLKLKAYPKISNKGKGEVWIDFNGSLMKANGKVQPSFRSFIDPHLEQIEFGDNSLAKKFFPLYNLINSRNIVVDPLHQFGQPVINGTNIQVATIYNLYKAGETKENISQLYSIENKAIEDVLVYFEKRA